MAEDYFKDVKQLIKELVKSQKKTDEQLKDIAERQKKTDEQLKDTAERQKKTDEQLKKTDEEIQRMSEEIRKVSEEIRKVSEEIRKVNKSVAGISDGFGRMTEGFAIASIEEVFKNIDISINKTFPRARSRRYDEELEIDLLNLASTDKKELVIAVEVKTYLRNQDVKDFLKDISIFYDFFEEYRNRELIGVIAFMNYERGAKVYAEKKGFYLLFCSEDLMKLANKENFTPKIWRYNN